MTHIRAEDADRTRVIRLDRPDKKNALTGEMYFGLIQALEEADRAPRVRCAVITGGADFTAGNDIGDFLAYARKSEPLPALLFLDALVAFAKPMIAAVRGVAIGVGTTMLLHCDGVVAGSTARFQVPFARIGLVPEAGSSLLLASVAGRGRSNWWMLSGEAFDVAVAREAGLVTQVVADDAVEAAAMTMAATIAALPPGAVRETKRLIREPLREAVAAAMRREAESFAAALRSAEAKEAFGAFLEKRKPDFSRF